MLRNRVLIIFFNWINVYHFLMISAKIHQSNICQIW